MLPEWFRYNLRKRENGRDILGISISSRMVRKVRQFCKWGLSGKAQEAEDMERLRKQLEEFRGWDRDG